MKAYKILSGDWVAHDVTYSVGKTYTTSAPIRLGYSGFHACPVATDCVRYHPFSPDMHVVEVTLAGNLVHDEHQWAGTEITIDREIPASEWPKVLGTLKWDEDGLFHSTRGAAIRLLDGYTEWVRHGKWHRVGGPAITCADGTLYWFTNGVWQRTAVSQKTKEALWA